jgi:hypothetical protein
MNYVTVVDNKEVEVRFTKSKEKLIEQYRIYKRPNDPDEQFLLYQVFDTSFSGIFTDTAVNVKQQSYCYQATLFNECGLESKEAFEHCTILLKGESLPFRHQSAVESIHLLEIAYGELPTEKNRSVYS